MRAYFSRSFSVWTTPSERLGRSKAADEGARVVELELLDDVGADVGRGRGRQRDRLRAADALAERLQTKVVGTKIVTPRGDAVRLVHGEERNLQALQGLDEVVAAEALGRDVEQLEVAAADARDALLLLLEVERAVDEGRGQAPRVESVHLVLHQRDERRDDDRHALAHERRELEAERLAAARRHHDDRVVAGQHRLDDLALPLAKSLEPEELAERGVSVLHVYCVSHRRAKERKIVPQTEGERSRGECRSKGKGGNDVGREVEPMSPGSWLRRSRPRRVAPARGQHPERANPPSSRPGGSCKADLSAVRVPHICMMRVHAR
jgi:hypothetical protein